MTRQQVKISLHIRHPTRDLSRVCRALRLEPKHIWKKGDERRTPKGNKIGGLREDSYCSIELGPTSRESISKKVEAALTLLEPHRALLRKLSSTGGTVSFFVGWFCESDTGERLSAQVVERMARFRIALDLNVYLGI